MNKLTVNQATGFLESRNSLVAFDAPKKARFLKLAEKYFTKTGKMPNITALCECVGISLVTYERHYRDDEKFHEGIREIKLKGKSVLEDKMFEYAQNKGGYMHMITWLRKEFPEEYNPDSRITVQHQTAADFKWLKEALENSKPAIESEIVKNDPPSLPPG